MKDNLFFCFFICSILIFSVLVTSHQTAVIPKGLSIHDCQPMIEEDSDPINQIAYFNKRVFNTVYDKPLFIFFMIGVYNLLPRFIQSHQIYMLVFILSGWLFYFPFMEYWTGRTLAKYISQCKVISADFSRPEFSQVLIRNLLRFIPLESFSFLKLYPVGWHDRFSKTIVVDYRRIAAKVEWEKES